MGVDTWTYHSTYRGIVIQEYTRSSTGITDYTAYIDGWFMSPVLSYVKSAIDDFLEPEPYWAYHSTYRGIDIEVYMPDGTPYRAYYDGSWYGSNLLSVLQNGIDAYLEPEPEPEPEPKKPSSLFIGAFPTSGTPPFSVTISVHLRNEIWMSGKTIKIYKNNTLLSSQTTDAGGWVQIIDTVTNESSYYASFAGDSKYEACVSPTITVTVEAPTERSTSLTISAPASVQPDETFAISGILYETSSGSPIPNQPISLSYNGVNLGSVTTGVDGDYLKQVSIPTPDTYTLKAAFAGTTTLGASEASSKMSTTGVSGLLPLLVIGGAAYVLTKKK